jgi:hypothetical protein
MRIDGLSSQSYPIKRKPRKGPVGGSPSISTASWNSEEQWPPEPPKPRRWPSAARQQDMIYHRAMSKSVAMALASYLSTAGFVDWDADVLGLDLYI